MTAQQLLQPPLELRQRLRRPLQLLEPPLALAALGARGVQRGSGALQLAPTLRSRAAPSSARRSPSVRTLSALAGAGCRPELVPSRSGLRGARLLHRAAAAAASSSRAASAPPLDRAGGAPARPSRSLGWARLSSYASERSPALRRPPRA
ncbi:hypothetical protein [Paenibacillus pasadenensis]|nr:hypothetical protein [Paenibacillus pasadenensis]